MNNRTAAKIGLLFSTFLIVASARAATRQKPTASNGTINVCESQNMKEIILNALNGSVEFDKRKIKLIDFQSDKTLSADVAKHSFACHGVLFLSGGEKFAGVLTLSADDKLDIDWYDDDTENGLLNINRSSVMPADESEFINIVTQASATYESAKTEFAKGVVRPLRAKAICAALKSPQANNWIGKLVRLTTNGDGKGVLAVEIAPNVKIKTFARVAASTKSATIRTSYQSPRVTGSECIWAFRLRKPISLALTPQATCLCPTSPYFRGHGSLKWPHSNEPWRDVFLTTPPGRFFFFCAYFVDAARLWLIRIMSGYGTSEMELGQRPPWNPKVTEGSYGPEENCHFVSLKHQLDVGLNSIVSWDQTAARGGLLPVSAG